MLHPIKNENIKSSGEEVGVGEDWCIPSDYEIYGRTCKLVPIAVDEQVACENEAEIQLQKITLDSFSSSFQSLNPITSSDEPLEFVHASESFRAENEELTAITAYLDSLERERGLEQECEDEVTIEYGNEEGSSGTIVGGVEEKFGLNQNDVLWIVDRITSLEDKMFVLEKKLEDLSNAKCEISSPESKPKPVHATTKNGPYVVDVSHLIDTMEEIMKTGLAYQKQFISRVCDELENVFDVSPDLRGVDLMK